MIILDLVFALINSLKVSEMNKIFNVPIFEIGFLIKIKVFENPVLRIALHKL